jgi:hypothetical protein
MSGVPRNGSIGVAGNEVAISGSGIRRFAGLPDDGLPEADARDAGRRLASHPLLMSRLATGDEAMPEILRDAHYLLNGVGLHFDVLRTRPGCAVVRAVPDVGVSPVAACELVRGLLETVTEIVCGVRGTILETTCSGRGSPACLYTLMWDQAPAAAPEDSAARPVGYAEPAPAPATTVHAAVPAAAPLTAYRYLGQVAPAQAPPSVATPPTAPNRTPSAPPVAPPAPAPVVASPPPPVAAPVEPGPARALEPSARSTGRKVPTWVLRRSWLGCSCSRSWPVPPAVSWPRQARRPATAPRRPSSSSPGPAGPVRAAPTTRRPWPPPTPP